jgi:hypothetical protein
MVLVRNVSKVTVMRGGTQGSVSFNDWGLIECVAL